MLKTVPWADVISTAPVVADGARKLWKAVARKAPADAMPAGTSADASASAPTVVSMDQLIASMQLQLDGLEQAARDSHAQMLESSQLIAALAEQNTQLIGHAETSRRRIFWLAAACAALALLAAANLALLLLR
ncbi:MAG: hypothetical protein ACRYGK_17170 [Janthinobacterium lividum]